MITLILKHYLFFRTDSIFGYRFKNPISIFLIFRILKIINHFPFIGKLTAFLYNYLSRQKIIISDKYKFIYIENPLVASNSMINLFIHKPPLDYCAEIKSGNVEKVIKSNKKYEQYLIFSIVRDPWSRIVSCYHKKILNAIRIGGIEMISQYEGIYPLMKFKEYLKFLCSEQGKDKNADLHWISQYKLLYDSNETPLCNYIIKLKNLKDDLRNMFHIHNIPYLRLPHEGSSKSLKIKPKFENFKKYYKNLDLKLIKNLEDRYKKDIDYFNYPKLSDLLKRI